MAKLPKKKPSRSAPKPAKSVKPKTAAKAKPAKSVKAPAKPATSAKPAPAKKPSKPAPAKPATSKKPKTAVKPAPTGKSQPPKKPVKRPGGVPLMGLDGGGLLPPGGGGGGGNSDDATPVITFPMAGATVSSTFALGVMVSTNRTDLGYVVTIQDVTPPGPPPAPTSFPGPNPTTNPFGVTIPAANLAPGRQYRLVATVNAASSGAPHTDDAINISTSP